MSTFRCCAVKGAIRRFSLAVTAAPLATLALGAVVAPASAAAATSGSCQVTNATTHKAYPVGIGAVLQTAIDAARPGDQITVKGLCIGNYRVAKNLNLVGLGAANPVLQGLNGLATLTVASGKVSVSAFSLTHLAGKTGRGFVNSGQAFLYRVVVAGNTSTSTGAGILNSGELLLQRSTVSGNKSAGNGGGILNAGKLTIVRSTVSGNVSGSDGGGAYSNGSLTVVASTFGANRATWTGGGLLLTSGALFEAVVLSGNAAGASGPDCAGPATSGGYNVIGTTDGFFCAITPTTGDKIGSGGGYLDALLAPLANNGGPTPTMALEASSPAIDVIPVGVRSADGQTALCVRGDTDQRLVTVPQGAACDAGAYERVK